MADSIDQTRLNLAWNIVEKIFKRKPDPDEGVGMEPPFLAGVLDGPIAKWIATTTNYRWVVVHNEDVTGVATVRNLVNLCYYHLVRASSVAMDAGVV